MHYNERLQNVTIIGAAGKMGSGITLLTAIEMANVSLMPENNDKKYILNALDLNKDALSGLVVYIKTQVTKLCEKKLDSVKGYFPTLSDETEISQKYLDTVLNVVNPVSDMSAAKDSTMIFEAAVENPDIKVKIFKELETINTNKPWYFTNTSSIPIHTLNDGASLEGRIVGFHFYNPPAVQKLVELIPADKTLPELVEFANQYAKKLRKVVVPSNDIAAFIGNGHFTRDILHAASEVELLTQEMPLAESVYTMNKVSQEYLVRPMGIFQLCDYVGLDVCSKILQVMSKHIPNEDFTCNLLDKYIEAGIIGGQNSDGSQKDGILKYENRKPASIYDYNKKEYVALSDIKEVCDNRLGNKPENMVKWKDAISSPEKDTLLKALFSEIKVMNTLAAQLTKQYGKKAVEIAEKLISDGVAENAEAVNTVMKTGYFHAYGPINQYF